LVQQIILAYDRREDTRPYDRTGGGSDPASAALEVAPGETEEPR